MLYNILFIYVAELHEKPFKYLDFKQTPGDFYIPKAGILYLTAALRRRFPANNYKIIDIFNPPHRAMPDEELEQGMVNTMSPRELEEAVTAFSPDVVGLSCLSANALFLPPIIEIVKKVNKETICILGGPFATSAPDMAVSIAGIDLVVYGEGEITLCNLVEKLAAGSSYREIPGIAFLEKGRMVKNPVQPYIENLDELPFPTWDLCNLANYAKVHRYLGTAVLHSDKTNYANIVSSRGCPYQCIYCHGIFGSKFRFRSAGNIIEEMLYLHEHCQVEEFTFSDDVFNLRRDRIEEFCQSLSALDKDFKFGFMTNGLRGDIITPDIIDLLYEAGMRSTSIAIESASPRIQKIMKKDLDLEKANRAIRYMCEKGIYVATFNMIGFPGETKEEIIKTLEFNINLPHHLLLVFIVTPHQGTPLYEMIAGRDDVPTGKSPGEWYWQPDQASSSFRDVSNIFLQLMLVKFVTKFYFSKKRFKHNIDIMQLNRDNPFYLESIKRFYSNQWKTYSPVLSVSEKEEMEKTISELLNFPAEAS